MDHKRFRERSAYYLLTIALLAASLGLNACNDGGKEFRRVLRSAAQDVGKPSPRRKAPKKKAKAQEEGKIQKAQSKHAIPACPKGAHRRGAAPPRGIAQWCEGRTKDGKPMRHGEYRRWHKNGNPKHFAMYQKGQLHGVSKTWYPKGNPREEIGYHDGVLHGASIKWNKDGSMRERSAYHQGDKHGEYALWNKKGRMEVRGMYQGDRKHGVWVNYHRNGAVKAKVNWIDGKIHGPSETYGRSEALLTRGNFHENIEHGKWIVFWNSGQKKSEGHYHLGQKHGPWVEYRRDGSVQKMTTYKKGAAISEEGTRRASARGQKRRKKRRRKRGGFGKGDVLGGSPPLVDRSRMQAPAVAQPPAEKKERETTGSLEAKGWDPL